MWNYLKSFIWAPEKEELSLDEAYNILQEETKDSEPLENDIEHDENISDYDSFQKVGKITFKTKNDLTIDELYHFKSDDKKLLVGSKVSYHLYLSNGKIRISDVQLLENDWDVVHETKNQWCSRTIVCKVVKRNARILTLEPGDIKVDLNTCSIEFIPIIGDWLELSVKSLIDEHTIDLSGNILEITHILPLRNHVTKGKVTSYNNTTKTGVISNKIFFNSESFLTGYIPIEKDDVICEAIESEQPNCNWRAVKIIPDCFKGKVDFDVKTLNDFNLITEHKDVIINSETIHIEGLSKECKFTISLKNLSENQYLLESAEFSNVNGQCRIISDVKNTTLNAKTELKMECSCISKNIGESKELIMFILGGITIGHWVNIFVKLNQNYDQGFYRHKPQSFSRFDSNKDKIYGRKPASNSRFAIRIPDYTLPQKLMQLFEKYDLNDMTNLNAELESIKPVLFSTLTFTNYEEKFHTLIHLEEIHQLILMRNYEQERAAFIVYGEYLILEIENLSERRPTIVVGDVIIATDPFNKDNSEYEGVVHKVGAKHVHLKFSSVFHQTYDGQDYSIRVVSGRTIFRRMHHAIHLAVRNLGHEILFTSSILEKPPQVKIPEKQEQDEPKPRKVLSPIQAVKKLKEYQNKTEAEKVRYKSETLKISIVSSSRSNLNIEWYNKSLNCFQKQAVENVILGVARPLPYIIFGPPGTGKTVTIIETVLQLLRHIPQSRLLIATPSNSAADLVATRLINSGVLKPGDLVRLVSFKHATNLDVSLVPFSAVGTPAKEGTAEVQISNSGLALGANSQVLGRHRITVTTCGSCGLLYSMSFPKGHFTHIIVDEAGQASEPEVMIPLTFLDKSIGQVILAGDPQQLGPVVTGKLATEHGLPESYLERLINRFPYLRDIEGFPYTSGYDPRLITKLRYNYRSLESVLKLTSSLFYNDDLIPTISYTDTDEGKLLSQMSPILPITEKPSCVLFHGVNGENYQTPDSPSWYNPHEAAQVFYYVNELYRLGLKSEDVGIITPYSKQAKEIRSLLGEAEFELPKIGTVEEFQGQECNVIILSTVRSSQQYVLADVEHSLGFVSSPRRLNVAISRAKVLLIIVGNPNLLSKDMHWRTILNYCIENQSYWGCDLDM